MTYIPISKIFIVPDAEKKITFHGHCKLSKRNTEN